MRRRRLLFESLEGRRMLAGNIWSQRGSDAGHSSYLDISVDPVSFVQSWNQPLTYSNSGTGSWSEEAVASDGVRVYRTALEGYAPNGTYHVIAYNLATGSEVWHRTFIGNAFEGVGEPSVAGGIVYVNRAGHSGISGGTSSDLPVLYGLNAATGATVMSRSYEAQWGSNERPAIQGTQLVVEDGYYGGMSSFTTTSLSRQWTRPGHQLEKPFAAIDDQYIYAYGEEVFNRTTGASLPSLVHPWQSASLTDPMVSASGRVLLDVAGSEGGVSRPGIAAYDGDTHQLIWTAQTSTHVGVKAVGNGLVAATAGQQLLIFSESSGTLLRGWKAPSNLLSEIVLTQTHAFVQSISSGVARVHAIDLSTAQEVWTFENRNSPSGTYAMEMAMAGGKLLLSNHDFVRAFSVGTANGAPIASNSSLATTEDVQVSGNLSASDPNGEAVTYAIVSSPFGGTLTSFDPATGSFTYRPSQNFNGNGGFTFKAIDARGAVSNVATVTITVAAVNDPPTAQSQSRTTLEDRAVEDFLFAFDVEDDKLTYALVTQPANGRIVHFDHNNGLFRYVPNANFNGTDRFTFRANDGKADSNTATMTIFLSAVNDAPVVPQLVVLDTMSGMAVNGQLQATDAENSALTYAIVNSPRGGTLSNFDPATGTFTYTPNAGFAGIDQFTYTASDGQLASNTGTIRVQVNYVNQPPVAIDQSLSTTEDTSLNGRLKASDDIGGATFAIVSNPLRGTITGFDATTGDFTYVPNPNHYGPDSFTFSISDGQYTDEGTVTIDVAPVSDAPVAAAVWLYNTDEDTSLSSKLLASDADNDALTYMIIAPPETGTLELNQSTGDFTYTPAANANGRVSLTYKVSDGALESNVGTLHIDIAAVNDAPVALSQDAATNEDTSLAGQLSVADVDHTSWTFIITSQSSHGTLTLDTATGAYTYRPNANYHGPDSFSFSASDGAVSSNIATVSIVVNSVNDVPVASGWQFGTPEDTPLTEVLRASDADGDALTYQIVGQPTRGTVTLNRNTGEFTYVPGADRTGTDSFTFQVSDGTTVSNIAPIYVTIHAVNDPPKAISISRSTNEDTALQSYVVAADNDSSGITFEIVTSPQHGQLASFDAATGAFVYVPGENYHGADSFTFRARDASSVSNVATISISVVAVNDSPVAQADARATNEEQPISGQLVATDIDSTSLTYSVVNGPTHGTLVLNLDGTYTYTSAFNFHGSDNFTFQAGDGETSSNVAKINITVSPVNDSPVAVSDAVSGKEDVNLKIDVLANDQDVDGDSLTIQIVAGPVNGTALVNSDGTITYDPRTDYVGSDSLTYKVFDGTAWSLPAVVTISLSAQVETPQISVTPDDASANNINLSSSEVAVAILASDSFNVNQVVVSSLRFGRMGSEQSLIVHKKNGPKYELRDVNGDGRVDLVAYFQPSNTGLNTSSTTATLSGRLVDGQAFSDSDAVAVTSSKGGGKPGRNTKTSTNTQATSLAAYDAYFNELEARRKKK